MDGPTIKEAAAGSGRALSRQSRSRVMLQTASAPHDAPKAAHLVKTALSGGRAGPGAEKRRVRFFPSVIATFPASADRGRLLNWRASSNSFFVYQFAGK